MLKQSDGVYTFAFELSSVPASRNTIEAVVHLYVRVLPEIPFFFFFFFFFFLFHLRSAYYEFKIVVCAATTGKRLLFLFACYMLD